MWICKGSLSAILSVHCIWHYVERSLPTESLLVFTHRPLQWSTHVQAHRRERASFIFILRVISNLLAVFTLILQGPCFHPVPVSPPILHTPMHMQIPTVSPSEAFSRCEERLGSETFFFSVSAERIDRGMQSCSSVWVRLYTYKNECLQHKTV